MELTIGRGVKLGRRHLIFFWAVTAALIVASIAAKAGVASWYRHRRDALAAAGELPSQIVARISATLPARTNLSADGLRAGMQVPAEPTSVDPLAVVTLASSNGVTTERVRFGDLARDGWTVTVPFGSDHRMHGWGTQYDDGRRIGSASTCSALIWRASNTIGPLFGLAGIPAILVTISMWRNRRSVGQYAVAAGLLGCTAASLSALPDRTFLQPGREAFHWTAIVVTLIAVGATFWPRRKTIDVDGCHTCHYDLTGNVSGVCPECGSAIAPSPVALGDARG